ncbi:GGDEF domain-containing phosphodiesterase [Vibrio sp. CAU 1672]|uniref:putative bifunctional diguanylate cyclase/phosphodiesterase n=1 Tax=Vibrio sp. CAU 1672 TaxID=3032594 RepID=UPI0023DA324F|nr:GGDEF domain-containing phosphodiesterase [Vibrio sp. CAU 1672]MDF2155366.1 EAL domain-containing protein [Vibrio sp. CAU 1672]
MDETQISFAELEALLNLDGTALLDKVTLNLHQSLDTYHTCVVEIAHVQHRASTLSYAHNHSINNNTDYCLTGTPCEQVLRDIGKAVFYNKEVYQLFPNDRGLRDAGIQAYLGLPLHSQSGEVFGILLSSFQREISDHEMQAFLRRHRLYANFIIHCLREKWSSERSDRLLNQLSYEVSHDNLTGLLNRSCLADKLEVLAQQTTGPFSLAYLDIDNFKSINDINGNYIGDQIIKFTANVIEQCLSTANNAFRVAGDEFAFIIFDEDPVAVCYQILDKIEKGYCDKSNQILFNVSIGIARASVHMLNSDDLILHASLALKECKKRRNTRIQHYDTQLSALYLRQTQLIQAMRTQLLLPAEEGNEFDIALQPIVDVSSTRWDHFEVLARWQSKTFGPIPPSEFIEAAEQSGLIVRLGEHIFELACRAKQTLEQQLGFPVTLSVNCSAYELVDSNRYINHLTAMLEKYDHKASDFVIELTETVLLSQSSQEQLVLDSLRYLGFKIALDDFGTGYSSLNYIHSYPIDSLKIDATFVQNMAVNTTSEQVVLLIAQLAQLLDVELIAEGVEDEQALGRLIDMGCQHIQGYYYCRPNNIEALIEIIQNRQVRSA